MSRTFTVTGGRFTGRHQFTFTGGPYRDAPSGDNVCRVCLLDTIAILSGQGNHYDIWSPIPDFGVPSYDRDVRRHLQATLRAALDGKDVYVGCGAGKGRTGLFLALLLRCVGAYTGNLSGITPIKYLRVVYDRDAVETEMQERYVNDFDVKPIQRWLFRQIVWRKFTMLFSPKGWGV